MIAKTTWVPGASGSLWDVDNLPYGVFAHQGSHARVGTRIGDFVFDLTYASKQDHAEFGPLFACPSLGALMAAGPDTWERVRAWVKTLLTDRNREATFTSGLLPIREIDLQLPFNVGDYVDFYASIDHASNVGRIFRSGQEPLLPNWRHLPVGYHGRSGTVVVSGTPVQRPWGQRPEPGGPPSLGPSRRLDIEAELGFVVGAPSVHGSPISTADFRRHVFGVVGLNDWSARDIQAWEYVPLGPFLGKSFATSVSAWVTPLAALEAATVALPVQHPEPLPYLSDQGGDGYDIEVEVEVNGEIVAKPPYRSMYWSAAQMLAHMTVNGASVRTGDLYGSGTISGPARDQRGSFLELSWGGTEPWVVGDGSRTFLEDGDLVVLRYTAPTLTGRLALGEVAGIIDPAR